MSEPKTGMNHLFQDATGITHACEGDWITRTDYLVWTLCKKDVPANKSFKSTELVTCPKCKAQKEQSGHE